MSEQKPTATPLEEGEDDVNAHILKEALAAGAASAALFDVRTGFVYGVAEASATEEQRGTFWSSSEAVDSARKKAEADAFQKLIAEIEKFWADVLRTHAHARAATPS